MSNRLRADEGAACDHTDTGRVRKYDGGKRPLLCAACYEIVGIWTEDEDLTEHWETKHRQQAEGATFRLPSGTWSDGWGERQKPTEDFITDLIAPVSDEQAEQRRRERDRYDAETLRSIVRKYHLGMVSGLIEEERRVLITVAHRLDRQGYPDRVMVHDADPNGGSITVRRP